MFIKEVRAEFINFLTSNNIETTKHSYLCKSLIKYLDTATKACYKTYVPPENDRALGKVIYNNKLFSIHSLNYILKLKKAEWECNDHVSIQQLKSMIKNQVTRFPNSKTFVLNL